MWLEEEAEFAVLTDLEPTASISSGTTKKRKPRWLFLAKKDALQSFRMLMGLKIIGMASFQVQSIVWREECRIPRGKSQDWKTPFRSPSAPNHTKDEKSILVDWMNQLTLHFILLINPNFLSGCYPGSEKLQIGFGFPVWHRGIYNFDLREHCSPDHWNAEWPLRHFWHLHQWI